MQTVKTLASAALLSTVLLTSSFAQQQPIVIQQPNVKRIEVNGSAELEVIPDRIFFSLSLREYFQDKDRNKVEIENLEKQLVAAVREAGVPKENFQIENIYGNRWQWGNKKKPVDFLESKRYVLELSDLSKIDPILAKVDAKGIEFVNISRYDHSKMEQFRKELKTKALQAAKEKATYLLQGIGEQVGGVMEVQEMGDANFYPQPVYARSNVMMEQKMAGVEMADAPQEPSIDFRKIKLRYEMRAVFAIK